MRMTRMAWAITGAGDLLPETMDVVARISEEAGLEVTVLVSKNAEGVLKWYHLWGKLRRTFSKVKVEKGPNRPFVAGPLQVGHYALLFVSPATANTTAKIVHGIADTLITNCVSQAVKGGTPVYIYPVDQRPGDIETEIPGGGRISIRTRRIDLENTERLRRMEGIEVLSHPGDIEEVILTLLRGRS
jgi:archaeoflavoprotein AfpA